MARGHVQQSRLTPGLFQCLGPDAASRHLSPCRGGPVHRAPGRLSGPNQEESNPRRIKSASLGLVALCRKAVLRWKHSGRQLSGVSLLSNRRIGRRRPRDWDDGGERPVPRHRTIRVHSPKVGVGCHGHRSAAWFRGMYGAVCGSGSTGPGRGRMQCGLGSRSLTLSGIWSAPNSGGRRAVKTAVPEVVSDEKGVAKTRLSAPVPHWPGQ